MVYRAIGLMSGSSLDGLDIAFAEFQENGGKWNYEILQANCYPYPEEWVTRLKGATALTALDYQLLHADYGHYLGLQVNKFIEENHLDYKVALVCFTWAYNFSFAGQKMTAQLGDGAAIAAETQLPVVSDLRALDIALGGQGAPIVPIGEKLLLGDYDFFLNLGGIANISFNGAENIAFDVCPANRVLNMLANNTGKEYDKNGEIAASGVINDTLLKKLNALDYYRQFYPKSLANDFGTDMVYPIVKNAGISINDSLRTYSEHITLQIGNAITSLKNSKQQTVNNKLLVTGEALSILFGATITEQLNELNIEVIVPDEKLVNYKEALIMALIGVLRWREEYNILSSVYRGCKR